MGDGIVSPHGSDRFGEHSSNYLIRSSGRAGLTQAFSPSRSGRLEGTHMGWGHILAIWQHIPRQAVCEQSLHYLAAPAAILLHSKKRIQVA